MATCRRSTPCSPTSRRRRRTCVVVGGDVVAGPLPGETLDGSSPLGDRVRWVMGNADRWSIEAYDRGGRPADAEDPIERLDAWVAQRLTRRSATGWPRSSRVRVGVDGLAVRSATAHLAATRRSSPRVSPDERLAPMLAGVAEDAWSAATPTTSSTAALPGKRLLNAGSVGMPYEDEAAAYWLLVGPARRAAAHRLRHRGGGERCAPPASDIDELMLRESLLEPVGAAFVARHFVTFVTNSYPLEADSSPRRRRPPERARSRGPRR